MKLTYDVIEPPGDKQTNAAPIVMLHGMLDSRKTWKYIAPAIARNTGRVVYIVDERNHGESPWSDEMDWSILGDDVGDFLDQNRIPRAVLVGHSMGGIASFTLALRRPELVDKLVVEDIATRKFRPGDGAMMIQIMDLLQESLNAIPEGAGMDTAKRAIAAYIKAIVPEDRVPTFPSFDWDMMPLGKKEGRFQWQANIDVLKVFMSTDRIVHDVSKEGVYTGDTMFMYGAKSPFKVHRDRQIERLFPQVVKVCFEEATHLIHHEKPDNFVTVVSNFINNGTVPMSKI